MLSFWHLRSATRVSNALTQVRRGELIRTCVARTDGVGSDAQARRACGERACSGEFDMSDVAVAGKSSNIGADVGALSAPKTCSTPSNIAASRMSCRSCCTV